MSRSVIDELSSFAIEKAIDQLSGILVHASDNRLMQMTRLLETISAIPAAKFEARRLRWLVETGHPFKAWLQRIVNECSPSTRRAFVKSVLVDSVFNKTRIARKFEAEHGFVPPNVMVVSPTQRCNMMCEGCWAGAYTVVPDMPFDTLHRIMVEAHDVLHNRVFVMTGGEPFIRKDLLDIYEEFNDSWFVIYTNGTLIDDKTAERLGKLGNTMPSLSLEGDKAMTDARRGVGTWDKLQHTFQILKANGVMAGYSATATRHNIEYLGSDEWIESMLDMGCLFGWNFQYLPIGRNPDTSLMPTPEQRNAFRKATYHQRNTYPIFVTDFWNDGPIVKGCMAGGRMYFHVNANGDVEPCVFAHFAVDNINNKSLLEALQSDFFTAIRDAIPYEGNLLRPCMIIDRPDLLRDYCSRYGAKATHEGGETILTSLSDDIDKYAHGVKELYDPAWSAGDWIKHYPDPPEEYR